MTNIYLIKDGASGLYKIGRSVSPLIREKTLLSQAPLIELHSYWPEQDEGQETLLHELFAGKRQRGEWFELNDDDIERVFYWFTDCARVDVVPVPQRLAQWCRVQDERVAAKQVKRDAQRTRIAQSQRDAVQVAVTEQPKGIGSQYSRRTLREMREMIDSARQRARQMPQGSADRAQFEFFAKGIVWASGVD